MPAAGEECSEMQGEVLSGIKLSQLSRDRGTVSSVSYVKNII